MSSRSRFHRARAWAEDLLRTSWCVLDVETTGLGADAEVVQIAVVAGNSGDVLFKHDVRPEGSVEASALALHGLDADRLAAAPSWPAVNAELRALLAGRRVIAFNADFDRRIVEQTCDRHGLPRPELDWECAMVRYAHWSGHWRSLEVACLVEKISLPERIPHSALSDALATWHLVRSMAGIPFDEILSRPPRRSRV